MKKVFAIIALLAVSLMFLTACSSIVLLNESLKYEMFYESLKATFYVDIGNDEVEYIDYDLNIYGRDKELLHKEHYEKVELYKGDNGKYYVKDFSCYYPVELVNNQDKIDCHDQDVINASINDRIEYIEDIYNAQVRRKNLNRFEKLKDPTVLHFISPKKPWSLYKPINSTPWAREYFEALKDTPWEDFIYEYKKQSIKYLIPNLLYPTGIFKNILRTIFSIKNSHDRQYKILTIFGIEIRKHKIKD